LQLEGGIENKHHTTGKQYSCYTNLQNKLDGTVWVLILTTLAPFLTGHLWGYCTSNAMTTFNRQSILINSIQFKLSGALLQLLTLPFTAEV
jgi:hypothetical protein